MADVFDVLFNVRFAQLAVEKVRMDISLLVALEEKGFKTCALTDFVCSFQILQLSTASRDMWYVRLCFVDCLSSFRVAWGLCSSPRTLKRIASTRCHSFYGRRDIVGYSAVRVLEQLLERP